MCFTRVIGIETYYAVWTEVDGQGKGGNAIASALLKILNSCSDLTASEKIHVWADSCTGQNKNKILLQAVRIW